MIRYTEDFNKYYLESDKCKWIIIYPDNIYFPKHIVIAFPCEQTFEILEGIKGRYHFLVKEVNLIDLYDNEFKEENICSLNVALTKLYYVDNCNDVYELINKEYIKWNTLNRNKPEQTKYNFETDFCNTILTKILINIKYSTNVLVKYINLFPDGFSKARKILYNIIVKNNSNIVNDYNSIIETDNIIRINQDEFMKAVYIEYKKHIIKK